MNTPEMTAWVVRYNAAFEASGSGGLLPKPHQRFAIKFSLAVLAMMIAGFGIGMVIGLLSR